MAVNTETTVYVVELRDRFTMGMNKMTDATNKFNKSASGATDVMSAMNKGLAMLGGGAAIAGIYRVIKGVVELAGKFEETRIAFNVMTGDKGMGKNLTDWAKIFSRDTIATFEQTTTSMRKLMAYGISPENTMPLTKMLTTIGAGVGMDRIPYLTLALGQVYSAGRLYGTELRQFREHGVDIVGEVAKGLGKGTEEVGKMVSSGAISFQMVAEALMKMTQEGGKFSGMLEEQAKTLPGAMSVLKDTIDQGMVDIFEPITRRVKESVLDVTKFVQEANMQSGAWSGILEELFQAFTFNNFKGMDMKQIHHQLMLGAAEVVVFFIDVATVMEMVLNQMISFFDFVDRSGSLLADPLNRQKQKDYVSAAAKIFTTAWDTNVQGEEAVKRVRAWALSTKPADAISGADPTKPGGLVFPDKLGGGGDTGDAAKLRNKTIGTGARDIIINIGNLQNVEAQYISTDNLTSDINRVRDNIARALLTVVNDVSTTVR